MRILLTAGGTGGHIYPMIAVAFEVRAQAEQSETPVRIRYVGAPGVYSDVIRNNAIEVKTVLSSKFRRYFSVQNFVDVPKFFVSVAQAIWHLYWFMPDVVFSKGGPGSLAIVLAARFYRIPVVIHETDSVPSLTGRITSYFARVIAVSFQASFRYFADRKGELVLTGSPIRRGLIENAVSHDKAKASLGFNKDLPLMLVMGGSQGAQSINDFIVDNLIELLRVTQVFHQTGNNNFQQVTKEIEFIRKDIPKELLGKYKAVGHMEGAEVATALSAADIVLSRAGGGIFEVAAFRKPAILVPLPGSADNHQLHNALEYEKTGAAVVVEEANLLPHLFIEKLKDLYSHPSALVEMSKATESFHGLNAASSLANIILTIKERR